MKQWNSGDIVEEHKSNQLLIIKGTTTEINNLNDDDLSNGSLIFDTTKKALVLNTGTKTNPIFKTFDNDKIAMIKMWHGDVPDKWKLCNGDAINRTTYSDLYDIIGTTFGIGNGSTTFNLPVLDDEHFIRTADANSDLGDTGGEASITLTLAQLPAHTHDYVRGQFAGTHLAFEKYDTESENTGYTGEGESHENRPPFLSGKEIIKVEN